MSLGRSCLLRLSTSCRFVCLSAAIESFAKLGDSIYFEDDGEIPSVYVAQFVSSDFVWDSAGLVLHQSLKPLNAEQSILEVTFSFSHATIVRASQDAVIHVRLPSWVRGCRAHLNGQEIESLIPGMKHSLHHVDQCCCILLMYRISTN